MSKYLKFLETLVDNETTITFVEGERYPVVCEFKGYYLLPSQDGMYCGIDKKSENKKYIVEESKCTKFI